MNNAQVVESIAKVIGSSPLAVKAAVKVRNLCNYAIKFHLCESYNPVENGEVWFAQKVAAKASTFIDVGANIGEWSNLVLEHLPEPTKGKGLLFDPSDAAIKILTEKFRQTAGIEILQTAVSDFPSEMFFYEEPDAGVTSSLVAGYGKTTAVKKLVKVTTLDLEVEKRQWEYIDFLKIDTEGYDLHVIKGAAKLLKQQKIGVVQFEYNSPWLIVGSSLGQAYKLLESCGYKVFLLRSNGLFEIDYLTYREYFGYSNFVAISPQKMPDLQPFIKGVI